MSRVTTWLWGQKRPQNYFRALTRHLPTQCRNLYLFPPASEVNYSTYLSSYLQNKDFKNQDRPFRTGASPSPKVPRHRRGTFSFGRNIARRSHIARYVAAEETEKIVLITEVNKIPSYYRAGLVNLVEKHKSRVYLCSIFKPHDLNFGLAEKSDFYCLKKGGWRPVMRELKNAFTRFSFQGAAMPEFNPGFTLREKLIMRIFFRFRQRFVKVEEISSYIYGRRMTRNLHTSEVILAGLHRKLKKITGRATVIQNVRNYGYQISDEIWDELTKRP